MPLGRLGGVDVKAHVLFFQEAPRGRAGFAVFAHVRPALLSRANEYCQGFSLGGCPAHGQSIVVGPNGRRNGCSTHFESEQNERCIHNQLSLKKGNENAWARRFVTMSGRGFPGYWRPGNSPGAAWTGRHSEEGI